MYLMHTAVYSTRSEFVSSNPSYLLFLLVFPTIHHFDFEYTDTKLHGNVTHSPPDSA